MQIKDAALKELETAQDLKSLNDVRVKYLGKKGELTQVLRGMGALIPSEPAGWWESIGLNAFDENRVITRLEAAVIIDSSIDPFLMFDVDFDGNII